MHILLVQTDGFMISFKNVLFCIKFVSWIRAHAAICRHGNWLKGKTLKTRGGRGHATPGILYLP